MIFAFLNEGEFVQLECLLEISPFIWSSKILLLESPFNANVGENYSVGESYVMIASPKGIFKISFYFYWIYVLLLLLLLLLIGGVIFVFLFISDY